MKHRLHAVLPWHSQDYIIYNYDLCPDARFMTCIQSRRPVRIGLIGKTICKIGAGSRGMPSVIDSGCISLETISEGLKFKYFMGEHAPR